MSAAWLRDHWQNDPEVAAQDVAAVCPGATLTRAGQVVVGGRIVTERMLSEIVDHVRAIVGRRLQSAPSGTPYVYRWADR